MKKQFNTRLTVKKQTVVNLENTDLFAAQGGAAITKFRTCTCYSNCPLCITISDCVTNCDSNPCC